jgi:endonuclease G
VVGGEPVPPGRWPDAAAVSDGAFAFCSGTLIAPDVVLSAGHCAEGEQVASVLLGATESDGPGEEIAVVRAAWYPGWRDSYDLSVLVLEHASSIRPRPVATGCVMDSGTLDRAPVTLVGFGATTERGDDLNTQLMEGAATIVDADCSSRGCIPAINPGGEFVAGGDGVDSCFGDSGGPVYLATAAGAILAGVVSRGLDGAATPCGGGGIYVRPDAVLDWIEETAGRPVERATCAPPATADPAELTGGCSGARRATATPLALACLALLLARLLRRRGPTTPTCRSSRPRPSGGASTSRRSESGC